MSLTYYDKGRYKKLPIVRVLFATNFLFAVAILVAWQTTLLAMFGPLSWAADRPFPTGRHLEDLFTYPTNLYWIGPALAMCAGWVLLQSKRYKAAFGVLMAPLVVLLIIAGLYGVLPMFGYQL